MKLSGSLSHFHFSLCSLKPTQVAKIEKINMQLLCSYAINTIAGNTLEGDVSDAIALDQLTSLFSPRKATRRSP